MGDGVDQARQRPVGQRQFHALHVWPFVFGRAGHQAHAGAGAAVDGVQPFAARIRAGFDHGFARPVLSGERGEPVSGDDDGAGFEHVRVQAGAGPLAAAVRGQGHRVVFGGQGDVGVVGVEFVQDPGDVLCGACQFRALHEDFHTMFLSGVGWLLAGDASVA